MMKRAWNFIKRHHRKGIFTVAVVGGGVLLTRIVYEKFQERRQRHLANCFENFRRVKQYETTEKTCYHTILSLISNLRSSIAKALDTDQVTETLKAKPSNKLELWEELKILSFTKSVISVYASSIFVLLLKIEFSIIGGFMYLNTINQSENFPNEIQEKFLESVEYFINTGVVRLIDVLKPIVLEIVGEVGLKEKLKLADVELLIRKIRAKFETCTEFPLGNLNRYVIPIDKVDCKELESLFNETSDIFRSNDCVVVLNQVINTAFANLSDLLTDFYLKIDETSDFVNPNDIGVPLAKLIPVLSKLIDCQCSSQPKQLVEILLQHDKIKSFSLNVYDAFSQPSQG